MPRFDPTLCLDLIQQHKVTNLFAVPPALLALAHFPDIGKYDTSSLTMIMSGAAPLPQEIARAAGEGARHHGAPGLRHDRDVARHEREPDQPHQGRHGRSAGRRHRSRRSSRSTMAASSASARSASCWTYGPQVMQGYWKNADATAETLPGERLDQHRRHRLRWTRRVMSRSSTARRR